MHNFRLNNGDEVRDQITGFTGVITGRTNYITGCDNYLVQPNKEEATTEKVEPHWFDDQRLIVLKRERLMLDNQAETKEPGGDIAAPSK